MKRYIYRMLSRTNKLIVVYLRVYSENVPSGRQTMSFVAEHSAATAGFCDLETNVCVEDSTGVVATEDSPDSKGNSFNVVTCDCEVAPA